jgi:hypothetical protein
MPSRSDIAEVVLPTADLATGREGYQFGLPAGTFAGKPIPHSNRCDVLILFNNGDIERVEMPLRTAPHLTGPSKEPPQPQWAFVEVHDPTHNPSAIFAKVRAPTPTTSGSIPLSRLPQRTLPGQSFTQPLFCTPLGLQVYGFDREIADLKRDYHLSNVPESSFVFHLEDRRMCYVLARKGRMLGIIPTQRVTELGLWTEHLVRLLEIFHCL